MSLSTREQPYILAYAGETVYKHIDYPDSLVDGCIAESKGT